MEQYGFNDKFEYKFKTEKGLSEEIVREISAMKEEPEWMLEKRLAGYKQFLAKPTPQWGGNLNEIDYNDIYYYLKPTDKKSRQLGFRARRDKEDIRQAGNTRIRTKVLRRGRGPVRLGGSIFAHKGGSCRRTESYS